MLSEKKKNLEIQWRGREVSRWDKSGWWGVHTLVDTALESGGGKVSHAKEKVDRLIDLQKIGGDLSQH